MGSASCEHVAAFKSLYRLQPLHILHRKLICPHSEFFSREAISLLKCMFCRSRRVRSRLHACLHCVFIGCFDKKHLHKHQKTTGHNLSIDLTFGNTHCASCRNYIYDDDFEKVRLACKNGHNHQSLPVWEPDKVDLNFLAQHRMRLTVDGKSTLGLRGLVNQGNTCFMNVVIQALTHSPVLRDYFLMEKHPKCPPNEISSCIVCEFSKIFQEFFSNENSNPMTPYRLLLLVWRNSEYLAGYEQQDAHEFLIAVLDMIHERLQPKIESGSIDLTVQADRSIIDQVFTGFMQSNVVCNQCGNISQTIDPLRDISLDIPQVAPGGVASLMDCLSKFTKKEQLGNASKINCKKCGKRQESSKQLTISRLPVVACLHLKRFEQTATGSRSKVATPVSFPKTLDMGPFMSSARNTSLSPEFCDSDHYKYELFAVVNHMGNLQSGHYTSFIRQTSSWFRCDDSLITKASIEQVLNSEAYLLFYHKKSIRF